MLTDQQLRQLPDKPQKFWRAAFQFVQANQTEWAWIEPGTEEFAAWEAYFRAQDWEPFAIREIRKKHITGMTMPTQWPEWFDKNFSAPRLVYSNSEGDDGSPAQG